MAGLNDIALVVASPAGEVLNTGTPLPTDGLPEWMRCGWCGRRSRDGVGEARGVRGRAPHFSDRCDMEFGNVGPLVPDGPFPVLVGRWASMTGFPEDGAIVELVEVTGPSHHADECDLVPPRFRPGNEGVQEAHGVNRYCHPDAAPDGWHTPCRSEELLNATRGSER